MTKAFDTTIEDTGETLTGPWRQPRQMLHAQTYESHASIHDDATAQKLGFRGGTIEGPTHFSQFAPLCEALWGRAFFETGCLSAHYRNAVYEGEEVRATVGKPQDDPQRCTIAMVKRDGTEVLRGTASVGATPPPSALDVRLTELKPLTDPVILEGVKVGLKTPRQPIRMDADQAMGELYPFSLREKLAVITEPSPWYASAGNPWGRPIIPMEMLSVLFQYTSKSDAIPSRGPSIGLFADQEIRLVAGPLFVGEDYSVEREVVALSGSRRTESLWVRSRVFDVKDRLVATMLLNGARMKESYANYAADYAALYGSASA